MKPLLCAGLLALLSLSAPALAEGEASPKGWLGVGIGPATPAEQQALGVNQAVPRVTRLFTGSPAVGGGVQIGDFILQVDGHPLTGVRDLVTRIGAIRPGTEVRLTVARGPVKETEVLRISLDLKPNMRALVRGQQVGKAFPHLTLEDPQGASFALGSPAARGRVWVVDWFTTWCGPCKRLSPHLAALQETYADRGVRVVGVTSEDRDVYRSWVADHPAGYDLFRDPDGAFGRVLMASVLPTVWVVDRAGTVVDVIFGGGTIKAIDGAVGRALHGPRMDMDGNVLPASPVGR